MPKKLYLKVSKDKYELPEYVAESVEELAEYDNTNKNAVLSIIAKSERAKRLGKNWHYRYIRITVEDDDELSS